MDYGNHEQSRLARRFYAAMAQETGKASTAVDSWGAVGTQRGSVRTENQDRVLAGEFFSGTEEGFRVVALSDGMGGLMNGQEAATLTLSSTLSFLAVSRLPLAQRLEKAAHHADFIVRRDLGARSGATLSLVVVTSYGEVFTLNVGDSRIYGFKAPSDLIQISRDDTLAGLASEGRRIDSRHNSSALLQHIGLGDGLEPNVKQVGSSSEFTSFVLTSDGVHWLGNPILQLIVKNASDPSQSVRRLLSLSDMTGAHDNASVGIMLSSKFGYDDKADDSLSIEFWTPSSRQTIFWEKPQYIPEVSARRAADEYRYPPEVEKKPAVTSTKKPRKRAQTANKTLEQPSLPISRPELVVEFDKDKGGENGNS